MGQVLLVEDDTEIRELIRDALAGRGFRARAVGTDEEAYGLLEAHARELALLVTDIDLGPGTTGFDVARRARQLNPGLKVIYITGHAARVDRFGVEGAEMFPKPFAPDALAARVAEILARP
ncbi:response regulator transcription factor [Phenylobacterium sp.]|uniref:response regulator transcription factor n=1 Tax=Phenylobacterium sp. TaxID=1871053 RepID=UPI0035B2270E